MRRKKKLMQLEEEKKELMQLEEEKLKLEQQNNLINEIYKEKIGKIYIGYIYKIDLNNKQDSFIDGIKGDNDTLFKDDKLITVLKKGSFKSVKEVLFYDSEIECSETCSFCIREIITREKLPFVINHQHKDMELCDPIIKNDKKIPVFIFNNKFVFTPNSRDAGTTVSWEHAATAKEIEDYMEYHLNSNSYNENIEFFDPRVELKRQLNNIYEQASLDYFKLMESRDYSEEYKIERVKQKYKKYLG